MVVRMKQRRSQLRFIMDINPRGDHQNSWSNYVNEMLSGDDREQFLKDYFADASDEEICEMIARDRMIQARTNQPKQGN